MPTRRGPRSAFCVTGCAVLLMSAAPAHSQSLGELARREAERRKESRASQRVYTNEDLSAGDAPAVSAPIPVEPPPPISGTNEAAAESTSNGPTVMEEDPVTHTMNVRTIAPAREKRSEAYWRVRAREVRGLLAKATADLQSAEAGLEAVAQGPQTPAAARERAIVAATVERLQSEVRYRQQDVTKLQMQAEFNKIPPEWIQ